jgi:hypothetical protein
MLKIGHQGGTILVNWVVNDLQLSHKAQGGFPMDGRLVSAESYNLKASLT